MEWQTMTAKQLAEKMNGREYMNEITTEEEREAYSNRLVAVFCYSDDCLEFAGYIQDEIGAFGGALVDVDRDQGVISRFDGKHKNAIRALWDACTAKGERAAWLIETDIPHETFKIYEHGELFCVGIVFCIDDLT